MAVLQKKIYKKKKTKLVKPIIITGLQSFIVYIMHIILSFFLCSVQHAHQYRFIVSFLLFVVTLKKHLSVKTVSMAGRLSGLNLFRTEIAVKFQKMWGFFFNINF